MPEKSGEREAGVSSWQRWTKGCSLGSNFTPVMGRRFVSCGPDLRATCQRELVRSCLRCCPRGATWSDTGTSAKQTGDILLDLKGSARHFK